MVLSQRNRGPRGIPCGDSRVNREHPNGSAIFRAPRLGILHAVQVGPRSTGSNLQHGPLAHSDGLGSGRLACGGSADGFGDLLPGGRATLFCRRLLGNVGALNLVF